MAEQRGGKGLVISAHAPPFAAQGQPRETMEFQSIEAVKRCVTAGMGVSVLPSVAVDPEREGGSLSALRWVEPFEVRTQMAWHEGRWRSPALGAFLEAAREVFVAASRTSSDQTPV